MSRVTKRRKREYANSKTRSQKRAMWREGEPIVWMRNLACIVRPTHAPGSTRKANRQARRLGHPNWQAFLSFMRSQGRLGK